MPPLQRRAIHRRPQHLCRVPQLASRCWFETSVVTTATQTHICQPLETRIIKQPGWTPRPSTQMQPMQRCSATCLKIGLSPHQAEPRSSGGFTEGHSARNQDKRPSNDARSNTFQDPGVGTPRADTVLLQRGGSPAILIWLRYRKGLCLCQHRCLDWARPSISRFRYLIGKSGFSTGCPNDAPSRCVGESLSKSRGSSWDHRLHDDLVDQRSTQGLSALPSGRLPNAMSCML